MGSACKSTAVIPVLFVVTFSVLLVTVASGPSNAERCRDLCSQGRCGACPSNAFKKRLMPYNLGVRDRAEQQVQSRRREQVPMTESCNSLEDIYRAVPAKCYSYLDWMVNKMHKSIMDE